MKYLGLWSSELRIFFFEKFIKPSGFSSNIFNVRSLNYSPSPVMLTSQVKAINKKRFHVKTIPLILDNDFRISNNFQI